MRGTDGHQARSGRAEDLATGSRANLGDDARSRIDSRQASWVEPAGAAGPAAAIGPLRDEPKGRRVALIVCGANIDREAHCNFFARGDGCSPPSRRSCRRRRSTSTRRAGAGRPSPGNRQA